MGLKEVLLKNDIPLPEDFDERMDVVIAALRRSPEYPDKLKKMKGGQTPDGEDWLGPKLVRFLDIITSPGARAFLRGIFGVIFFMSYLEKIPVFGNILSAVLDLMTMGGKMLVKTVQKAIPPTLGLIPLPYMSLVGIMIAALFGYLVWPIIAIVSLSRQDFTAAVDSFVRIIPPPIGDAIADLFLEANRTVARLDAKRVKLSNDLANVFNQISGAFGVATEQAAALGEKTKEAAVNGMSTVMSLKDQATARATALKDQASSFKDQASSFKDQASSFKDQATARATALKDQAAALKDQAQAQASSLKAGKRLSRRTRGTYKWHKRTRRRSVRR
jgi:hypothetical protein